MTIEWILGGGFVTLHAFRRYNSPPTNRNTTTFSQFATYGGMYCCLMILLYLFFAALLASSPENLGKLREFLKLAGTAAPAVDTSMFDQSTPFVAALLLTALLPNVPWLSAIDQWLLRMFWDLGGIPTYSIIQAESLRRAGYHVDPGRRRELQEFADKFDLELDSLALVDHGDTMYRLDNAWASLASLHVSLSRWRETGTSRVRLFISNHEKGLADLREEIDHLTRRFANLRRNPSSAPDDEADSLRTDINHTYERLTDFVSSVLCSAELTMPGIRRRARELGFNANDAHASALSANELALVSLLMFGAFFGLTFAFNLFQHGGMSMPKILSVSWLMMLTYGAALVLTLKLKELRLFARNELTSRRSWLGYILSGLGAGLTWLFVAWGFRYIEYMLTLPQLEGTNITGKVLANLEWSYPYALQSFVIAASLSWLVDCETPVDRRRFPILRLRDSAMMVTLMVIVSLFIYRWMYGIGMLEPAMTKGAQFVTDEHRSLFAQLTFVTKHAMIGAVIGLLVPSWYRANRSGYSYLALSRMISMNRDSLNDEARILQPKALLRAFAAIAVWIGRADSELDRSEIEVFDQIATDLSGLSSADFTREEANEYLQSIQDGVDEPFLSESVADFRALDLFQALIKRFAVAIAFADRVYSEEEVGRLQVLLAMLPRLGGAHDGEEVPVAALNG